MDLQLGGKRFVVTGAGSGFGKAVTMQLLNEGANVLAITRTASKLDELKDKNPGSLDVIEKDVIIGDYPEQLSQFFMNGRVDGLVVNAGGPPAVAARETSMQQWDEAYQLLLRWKVKFVRDLLPVFEKQAYGRILFIESASVKQPMDNLVLSTAFRLAVVGFAKSLATEVAAHGITVNVMAPGFHDTAAVERIFKKQAMQQEISIEQAREKLIRNIPVQRMGDPDEFASLAAWLLSPHSGFITGQTISVDGGQGKYIFG
ncbi:MAG: SDR family oxidoreductase [Bacteroidales bacterium]